MGAEADEKVGMSMALVTSGMVMGGGESMYEVWLLTLRSLEASRESRRARSLWRLSSLCSSEKEERGLEVRELAEVGGVKLGSEAAGSDEISEPTSESGCIWLSRGPAGQVKGAAGCPNENVGLKGMATALAIGVSRLILLQTMAGPTYLMMNTRG